MLGAISVGKDVHGRVTLRRTYNGCRLVMLVCRCDRSVDSNAIDSALAVNGGI